MSHLKLINTIVKNDRCRKCDIYTCMQEGNDNFEVFHGCGHSYHMNCFPDWLKSCTVCKDEVSIKISELCESVTAATFNNGDSSKRVSLDSDESEDG